MEIHVAKGTEVKSAEGEAIGHVDYVVIDPVEKKMTHVVVEKGLLFKKDRLIPLSAMMQTEDGELLLREGYRDIEQFPPFEQNHYISPEREIVQGAEPGGHALPLFYYPSTGTPWFDHDTFPESPVASVQIVNLPEETIPIDEGTTITSSDGEAAGQVERIITQGENITHIVMSQGMLFKEKKLIPIHWVRVMGQDEIRLRVDNDTIEDLPEYSE